MVLRKYASEIFLNKFYRIEAYFSQKALFNYKRNENK